MSEDRVRGVGPIGGSDAKRTQQMRMNALRQDDALEMTIMQEVERDSMLERSDDVMFGIQMFRNAESLEKRQARRSDMRQTNAPSEEEDKEMVSIDGVAKSAEEYENRNPEMEKRALLSLKQTIDVDDSAEEILLKILKSYRDHYLADEALSFLIDTTDTNAKIGVNLRKARDLLNERFGREVRAGRNITAEAREFAKQGLGSPTALRDLYRDVTGNPREAVTLFEELNESFTFDKMKTVLQFMLHSLGRDINSKGPSIDPAELQRLVSEVRTMQAILSVYRFFFERMRLIEGQFLRENIPLPGGLTFELLAKQFVKILAERYPSPDKILKLATALGISEEVLAQIIIYTQYRDALRGVSPRLFKSDRHRQDLLTALIETVSELDDLLEEEGDEENEDI